MAEWVSYESADTPPAEVSIDVDFDEDTAFKSAHPYAAIVTIDGFKADSDGQPDDSTAASLFDLERQCEAALAAAGGALVCTVSENGSFTLYGYVADSSGGAQLRNIASPPLRIDVRCERDDAWEHYGDYILRGEELEGARDVEQLGELEDNGALLDEPVDVTFYLEFDDHASLREARDVLRNAGYAVTNSVGERFDDGMTVEREIILNAGSLASERANLQRLIAPYNGAYDGWSVDEDTVDELDEPDEVSP